MRDFFAFRTMISATVIQVVFVLGLIGIVIAAIGAMANDQAPAGLLILVFGALYWRILCEFIIVVFRMNTSLNAIRANTSGLAPAFPSPPPGPGSLPEETAAPAGSSAGRLGERGPGELPSCLRDIAARGLVRRLRASRSQALVGRNGVGDEGRRALFGLNADEALLSTLT